MQSVTAQLAGLADTEAQLRGRCSAAKAQTEAHLTGQLTDMTRLTAAWRVVQGEVAAAEAALEAARVNRVRAQQENSDYFIRSSGKCASDHFTVAPVMFGKPLLNDVLTFDHVQLQKWSGCWGFRVICQCLEFAKL